MTAPITDVSSLPGEKITDQEENPIGKITEIFAIDGDGEPMWVAVEASFGLGDKRSVLIPLARIKDENGTLRVPYSKGHIENTPEVDVEDGISSECDRKLRDHFGIDRADQELREDNDSYATLVTEDEGTARRAEDPDSLETPDADTVTDETRGRLEDPGSAETRHVTMGEAGHGDQEDDGSGDDGKSEDAGSDGDEGSSDDG
jgi:hypothetical protein